MTMAFENRDFQVHSDETLVAFAQAGDKEALEFMTGKYFGYVRNKARAYFLVGGDEEDIIQEGLIGLYEAIKDYSPYKQASFKTFADICITRQILNAIKTASRQKHIPLNTYVSLNKPMFEEDSEKSFMDILEGRNEDDPEAIYINAEMIHEIGRAIRLNLSEFEFSVLQLYLQGEGYGSIAKSLRKEDKAIDNAIQRIRKKLSRNLVEG